MGFTILPSLKRTSNMTKIWTHFVLFALHLLWAHAAEQLAAEMAQRDAAKLAQIRLEEQQIGRIANSREAEQAVHSIRPLLTAGQQLGFSNVQVLDLLGQVDSDFRAKVFSEFQRAQGELEVGRKERELAALDRQMDAQLQAVKAGPNAKVAALNKKYNGSLLRVFQQRPRQKIDKIQQDLGDKVEAIMEAYKMEKEQREEQFASAAQFVRDVRKAVELKREIDGHRMRRDLLAKDLETGSSARTDVANPSASDVQRKFHSFIVALTNQEGQKAARSQFSAESGAKLLDRLQSLVAENCAELADSNGIALVQQVAEGNEQKLNGAFGTSDAQEIFAAAAQYNDAQLPKLVISFAARLAAKLELLEAESAFLGAYKCANRQSVVPPEYSVFGAEIEKASESTVQIGESPGFEVAQRNSEGFAKKLAMA